MSTWRKTRIANLLRHQGGRYYARFHVGNKPKFFALKTDKYSVAKVRLAEKRVEIERARASGAAVKDGLATMGDLMRVYLKKVDERRDLREITERTRQRYLEHAAYLTKTWEGFADLHPDKIDDDAVFAWKMRALQVGTGYRPPGAKGESPNTAGRSPGTFNKAFDCLIQLLNIAVKNRVIVEKRLVGGGYKVKLSPAKPSLPDKEQLLAVFDEVERGSGFGGHGVEAADFLRFLAFTGCRLNEAGAVRWQDVDLKLGFIKVRGTKTDAAERDVPIIPDARELLAKIRARRELAAEFARDGKPWIDPSARVIGVREAQKSLDRACKAVGVDRLTHHSMRDAFATTAVEAGVDYGTVAQWLGHADGGALLMKTYKAHRPAHSTAQAALVSFSGT